jgi:tetratricopeptide (TPR) repeat protein
MAPSFDHESVNSLTSTLIDDNFSFEGDTQLQNLKSRFLHLVTYFDSDGIHEDFFRSYWERFKPDWGKLFSENGEWNTVMFGDVLDEFQNNLLGQSSGGWYGFRFRLKPNIQGRIMQEHPVHEQRECILQAISVLRVYLESKSFDRLKTEQKKEVLRHVDSCVNFEATIFKNEDAGILKDPSAAYYFATLYQEYGRFSDAELFFGIALSYESVVRGVDDPICLQLKELLAVTYNSQADFEACEKLLNENLEAKVRIYGKDNKETLQTIENLANCYRNQGFLAGHEPWSSFRSNYAILCCDNGKYEEASNLFNTNLVETHGALGSQHPHTLLAKHNLATVYSDQRKDPLAKKLFEEVLLKRTEIYGWEHPDTISTARNLAMIHMRCGNFEDAKKLLDICLESSHATVGANHPDTLGILDSLGVLYGSWDQFEKARFLFQDTLARSSVRNGLDHPQTLRILGNLAFTYQKEGDHKTAIRLFEETLWRMPYKNDHPEMLRVMGNLEYSYNILGEDLE